MESVNPLRQVSPFLAWLVSTLTGAKTFVWVCIIGALISVVDIVQERKSGIATARMGSSKAMAIREKTPEEFDRIIQFEVLRTIGLVVIAGFVVGSINAVANYDIFAPGQKFNSLNDKTDSD